MNHSFNVEIATQYGIEEAIVLENLHFWIEKNKANKKHRIDGNTWTYNSQEAFTQLFPYMNRPKIQRVMVKLEKEGLILRENFNEKKYDKTTWYALTPYGYSLFKMNNPLFKMNNPSSQIEQPIPDINTDINTDINKDIYTKTKKTVPVKKNYAEFVNMTEIEYNKLVTEHGEEKTQKMITVLDNYKGSNDKKYASDYRAILTWVVEKVNIKTDKKSQYTIV